MQPVSRLSSGPDALASDIGLNRRGGHPGCVGFGTPKLSFKFSIGMAHRNPKPPLGAQGRSFGMRKAVVDPIRRIRKLAPESRVSVDKPCGRDMAKKIGAIRFRILPLTPDLWPALEDLFGKSGASNGCWCMYWRLGGAYREAPRGANREALRQIVGRGSPPGLLAFDGDLPVGWCQLTPRDALPWLDHMWWFVRVDAVPVWSISSFFVQRGYRRQGVMT